MKPLSAGLSVHRRRYPARTPSALLGAGPQVDAIDPTCAGCTARSTAMKNTRVALHATELSASRIFAEWGYLINQITVCHFVLHVKLMKRIKTGHQSLTPGIQCRIPFHKSGLDL